MLSLPDCGSSILGFSLQKSKRSIGLSYFIQCNNVTLGETKNIPFQTKHVLENHCFFKYICWRGNSAWKLNFWYEKQISFGILWMWNSLITVTKIKRVGYLSIKDMGLSLLLSVCPLRKFISVIRHPWPVTSHCFCFCSSDSGYLGWVQSGSNFFTSSCPYLEKNRHVNLDHLLVIMKHAKDKVHELLDGFLNHHFVPYQGEKRLAG